MLILAPIPGLAQICLGDAKKGAALLLLAAGAAWMFFAADSFIFILLGAFLYLATALPAAVEAVYKARNGSSSGLLDSKPYVVFMLLTTGFSALPLLWQSGRFSKRAKIVWSVAVPVLAGAFFGALSLWGHELERFLGKS